MSPDNKMRLLSGCFSSSKRWSLHPVSITIPTSNIYNKVYFDNFIDISFLVGSSAVVYTVIFPLGYVDIDSTARFAERDGEIIFFPLFESVEF